jgi:hypothetical protein
MQTWKVALGMVAFAALITGTVLFTSLAFAAGLLWLIIEVFGVQL